MAYTSSRTPSRGSYSRGGGGGGQNMVAYAVAGVLVVLVIVIFMVVGGKKKDPAPQVPTTPTKPMVPVATPTPKGTDKPYPPVDAALVQRGKELVNTFEKDSNRASELYKESLTAKKAKDDKLWQSKLKEARGLLENINDQWNEYLSKFPATKDWDTDDVAKHYLPHEMGRVQKYVKLLANMKTDEK